MQTYEDECDTFRKELLELEEKARDFIKSLKNTGKRECIAQATLAMRHLEDARMRYEKVLEYIYPDIPNGI